MPATHAIVDNADGSVHASNGYVFPPCIIIERGESLDQWARRESERDFVTTLQVCFTPRLQFSDYDEQFLLIAIPALASLLVRSSSGM